MAITPADISRLKSQLQVSSIQNTNNPLYQVIDQLIGLLSNVNAAGASSNSITNNTKIVNSLSSPVVFFGDDSASDDGLIIPGTQGADGSSGMVPYFIAATETFVVPVFKQATFAENIDNEGILELDGHLIEVD